MCTLRKSVVIVALVYFVLSLLVGASAARPHYLRDFVSLYEAEYKDPRVNIRNCTICHKNREYRTNNRYSEAFREELGAKNVRDADVIEEALRRTEDKPSAVEGFTFGELIRSGHLPGKGDE